MIDKQWQDLLRVINGELLDPIPAALIIDSPWLPGWAGISTLDYFTDDRQWLDANLKALRHFDKIMFLPGFWSEYGMCTEPSAFGAKCIWPINDFPRPGKMLHHYNDVRYLTKPNCQTDGLLPFVTNRLRRYRSAIEDAGHGIRFAVSRGPLNITSFLVGHNEMFIGMKTKPDELHKLISLVTDFTVDWLINQKENFDSIEGIFILDDMIGFSSEIDFQEYALPYLKKIFKCMDVPVRILHNDATGLITARYLTEIGVNVFNFSHNHGFNEIRRLAGDSVVLMGNIPKDIMAHGTPEDVHHGVTAILASLEDQRRIILSCGGGMPAHATTANVTALQSECS